MTTFATFLLMFASIIGTLALIVIGIVAIGTLGVMGYRLAHRIFKFENPIQAILD